MPTNELTVTESRELTALEEVVERNLASFVEAGNALCRIRDERLYRQVADTFEAYLRGRWGMSRTYAHRLIDSAKVMENVANWQQLSPESESSHPLPTTESQARELGKVAPERQAAAWDEAVRTAPRNGDGEPKVTAQHVRETVRKETRKAEPKELAEEETPLDEEGQPLPAKGEFREVFAERETFRDLARRISQIKSELSKLGERSTRFLRRQQFEADLTNARREVLAAMPHAVCPYCKGNGCKSCKSGGWVNKLTYEGALSEIGRPSARKGVA